MTVERREPIIFKVRQTEGDGRVKTFFEIDGAVLVLNGGFYESPITTEDQQELCDLIQAAISSGQIPKNKLPVPSNNPDGSYEGKPYKDGLKIDYLPLQPTDIPTSYTPLIFQ